MAKSHNQKAKILYLERMLRESSTVRPISMQEILDRLGELGIRAERKSIYDDMETLKDFGMASSTGEAVRADIILFRREYLRCRKCQRCLKCRGCPGSRGMFL